MSRLKLLSLKIENFKGIKRQEVPMDGRDTEIAAENGVGKTTVYDGFLWLLFGKDSTGRTDFGIRPLDRFNEPIKGLVTVVEALIRLDGEMHVLRKELHENVVKKQLRGYTSVCSVNAVPKLVKEYNAFIEEQIASADRFRLLTDISYFPEILHHAERRKVLIEMAMAGEMPQPEGYDRMLAEKGNLSLDDFKKKISDEKKGYEKERKEINPRIDELMRNLEQPDGNLKEIESKRDSAKKQRDQLKSQRAELVNSERKRQEKYNNKNRLMVEQNKRLIDLQNDPARTKALTDEKAELIKKVSDLNSEVVVAEGKLKLKQTLRDGVQFQISEVQSKLEEIRKKYTKASEEPVKDKCYACGQTLPADILEKVNKTKEATLKTIEAEGTKHKAEIKELTEKLESVKNEIFDLQNKLNQASAEFEQESARINARMKEIDKKFESVPEVDPTQDKLWSDLGAEIKQLEAEIGEPASEQLARLDSQIEAVEADINNLNETLSKADRIKKDAARVQELQGSEKELAQLIADRDELLHDIQEYKREESNIVTEKVNDLFEVVTFKMFEQRLDKDAEDKPCCEAIYQGVPYAEMSFGQRKYCGLDIINTLCRHYDFWPPLFIDHAESMTLPIECKAQTILLRAEEGVKELQVKTKEPAETEKIEAA